MVQAQVATALGMAAEQLGERVDREAATVEDLVEEMGRLVAAINASTAGGPQRYKTLTQFIDTHMGPLFIRAAQLERCDWRVWVQARGARTHYRIPTFSAPRSLT